MKQFILMFVAVMFLANTFVVSAWAKPCVNMDMQSSNQQTNSMGDMPCHDMPGDQKNSTAHCDGVCLCLHASINQTSVLNNGALLSAPIKDAVRLLNKNERVASMSTAPPSPPPKTNS